MGKPRHMQAKTQQKKTEEKEPSIPCREIKKNQETGMPPDSLY
jgi:hypothetical protein